MLSFYTSNLIKCISHYEMETTATSAKPHHSKQIKEEGYHFDKIRNVKKCKLLQSRILCRAQTQYENDFMNVFGAFQH